GAREEHTAAELNDRSGSDFETVLAERSPGWSPASFAAFAVLGQIAIIYLCAASQQTGSWLDGTALYYALEHHALASPVGAMARHLPRGLLAVWTHVLHYGAWAIPVLVFVPGAPRVTRGIAAGLSLFYGLTFAVLFEFGFYGWALAAASALLIPIA